MTKIAVCVPARDEVDTMFALDLAKLVGFHLKNTEDEILLFHSAGTLIANQRQELAAAALNADADYILYLDSDMRFPKDVIMRFLAHDAPVVAANYSTRKMPIHPVAFLNPQLTEYLYTRPESDGLEECLAVGMGVFMVKASIFKELELPWFMIGYSPTTHRFQGEDIYFCGKLRQAGYPVMIDHNVSQEVKHAGRFEFATEHNHLTSDLEKEAAE